MIARRWAGRVRSSAPAAPRIMRFLEVGGYKVERCLGVNAPRPFSYMRQSRRAAGGTSPLIRWTWGK